MEEDPSENEENKSSYKSTTKDKSTYNVTRTKFGGELAQVVEANGAKPPVIYESTDQ